LVAVLCAVLVAGAAFAAVPQTINYQGYLTNSSGQPVNGPVNLTFALYSVASGPDAALWTETHTGVMVTNGVYGIVLGNGSPTPSPITLPFDSQYWLGITVGNDSEMTPRQALTVVPYAIRSVIAEAADNAGTLGGKLPSDYALTDHGHSSLSDLTLTGPLALPATHPQIKAGSNTLLHTSGSYNTFVGVSAGNLDITGFENTGIGNEALLSNTSGNGNTATGAGSLKMNSTGHSNTATGARALLKNTTGSQNTAVGSSALLYNTTGFSNTALGFVALYKNTEGEVNTALGNDALYSNKVTHGNVAVGAGALMQHNSNSVVSTPVNTFNTAVGIYALSNNNPSDATNGLNNTALGAFAGDNYVFSDQYANVTGSNNTFIGAFSGLGTSTQHTNATAIGYKALVSQSNSLVLGGTGSDAVKVGIGTQVPAQALDVVGYIQASQGFIGDGSALTGIVSTTASRLAADPSDCPAGSFAYAINAYGNLTCTSDGASLIGVNAATLGGQSASAFSASVHTHTGGQITSAVANATNAVNATNATNAVNADTVDNKHAADFAASGANTDISSLGGLNTQASITVNPFGIAAGNTGEIRMKELVANGANYVGLKAPDNIAADKIWTLPAADGIANQVLKTDGAGNLSWTDNNTLTLQSVTGTDTNGVMRASNTTTGTSGYLGGTYGVYGQTSVAYNSAVYGQASGYYSTGVFGQNMNADGSVDIGYGVKGQGGNSIGILGMNSATWTYDCNCFEDYCDTCVASQPGAAVYGQATSPAYAGLFGGDVSVSGSLASGAHTINDGSAATIALVVRGAAGQTANLQEWQNSAGSAVATISPAGVVTSKPVIWSGGCSTSGTAGFWQNFCLDTMDFNTASAYLTVATDGTITFLKSGYYRINARAVWAAPTGINNMAAFYKNGSYFHYDYLTGSQSMQTYTADVTWPFNAGDNLVMQFYNGGGSPNYAYYGLSFGKYNRFQINFVGSL